MSLVLAISIDYSLFMMVRYRVELMRSKSHLAAVALMYVTLPPLQRHHADLESFDAHLLQVKVCWAYDLSVRNHLGAVLCGAAAVPSGRN